MRIKFYFLAGYPIDNSGAGTSIISIHAQTDEATPRIVMDDQDGDEHSVGAVPGSTAVERATPGTKNYLVSVFANRYHETITAAEIDLIATQHDAQPRTRKV